MSAYIEDQSDYWLASALAQHMSSLEVATWPPVVQRQIEGQILAIESEQARRTNIRRTQAQAAAQGLTIECINVSFVATEGNP